MTSQAVCRVAIVDGHEMMARAVTSLLASTPGLAVVGVASDLAGAIDLLNRTRPDVVVCDTLLGDESGFYLLERYSGGRPAFVIYSSDDHPIYHRAALEGGAAAFVLKTAPPSELVAGVMSAATGKRSFSASSLRAARWAGEVPSARELAVLEHLARGLSSAEIAAALGITRQTVDAHLHHLFGRAGVRNRTTLVLHAVREGWIRPRTSASAEPRAANGHQTEWLAETTPLRASRRTHRSFTGSSRRTP